MRFRPCAPWFALLASCAAPSSATTTPSAPPETQPTTPSSVPSAAVVPGAPNGEARLPATVRPTRCSLDLTIDPAAERLTGSAVLTLDVAAPVRSFDLHAEGLALTSTALRAPGPVAVTTETGPHGGLRISAAETIPAGKAELTFTWTAPFAETADGCYRFTDAGDRYVMTQFETIFARRAFPCFDEPGFKTVWDVTLRVPQGLVALTNAPEKSRSKNGALDVVTFAPTPPLPTYLVAWAVGPWDVVAAPAGAASVPIRVIAARGKGRLAPWALDRAPRYLTYLEGWFGGRCPFDKLDLLAAPKFDWGGMENPGLVTFREDLLLLDAANAGPRERVNAEDTMAHELAHLWFGDLVTPAWWDDLWLNEAFATWMATKALDAVSPELDAGLDALAGAAATMRLDSRADTRAVRQPIEDAGDLANAFDDITYGKGARILAMTEAWIGTDVFRDGVRAYLAKHAGGTATAADLLHELTRTSGEPVAGVLLDFLDRPGVPRLDISWKREGLARSAVAERSRWCPEGTRLPASRPWRMPVFLSTPPLPGVSVRMLSTSGEALWTDTLDSGERVRRRLLANADGAGWYVVVPPAADVLDLAHDPTGLTRADRTLLATQIPLLLDCGALSAADAIDATLALAADGDQFTVRAAAALLQDVARSETGPGDVVGSRVAVLTRTALGPHFERVGPHPKAGEPAGDAFLRSELMLALGTIGRSAEVRATCRAGVEAMLADLAHAPSDALRDSLTVAASGGDPALWERLRGALAAKDGRPLDPAVRHRIVAAMGSFQDPALVTRTCDLLLDRTLRTSEDLWYVLGAPTGETDAAGRARWTWLTRNYATLRAAVGDETAQAFPSFAERFRTKADRDAVAAFFASVASPPEGTERNLKLALAVIEEKERRSAALRAGLDEYLARAPRGAPGASSPSDARAGAGSDAPDRGSGGGGK
jgi:alanyl aminopeptidase